MRRHSVIGTLAYVLFGPLVWAIHIVVIYGGQSMLCAAAGILDPSAAVRSLVALASVLALTIVAAATLGADRAASMMGAASSMPPLQQFQRRVMRLLAVLSLFGIGASAVAAAMPVCAALR